MYSPMSFSKHLLKMGVRATGLQSFKHVILFFFGMGTMVDFLKHEGITDRERDRLKMSIKTPASWNDSSSRCYFETNLATDQIRGLVCQDRSQGRILPHIHPSVSALWCKNEKLFVCFGPPNKGPPAFKQRMRRWVVEAISLAYESAGQPSPMAVRSHSTRSMVASKALISGVALQEVCDATCWSSPHTFIRFYSLDLDSTPGSLVLSF